MTAAARRKIFQTKKSPNPVLQMNDKVAFFQFGKVDVKGGTDGQRVRGFQPAWPLDSVAPENFRVGDDNEFCFVANEAASKHADMSRRSRVEGRGRNGIRLSTFESRISTQAQFIPDLIKPLPLAVVVAEDMNGVTMPQPAVELVEKFAALRLGDLRVGRAFAERTKGVERGKSQSLNSNVSIARFELRHGFPVDLGEKISPRNEKWIVFGDLPRVFVGGGGELFRFAQKKNGFTWEVIQQRGQ